VLAGSPADRDGRIQKGDRILSINGRSMKGVTHRESLNILKVPRHCTSFCIGGERVTRITLYHGVICVIFRGFVAHKYSEVYLGSQPYQDGMDFQMSLSVSTGSELMSGATVGCWFLGDLCAGPG
jgi:hypothetical protein